MMQYLNQREGQGQTYTGTADYWGGFFNGVGFPDLQVVQLYHVAVPNHMLASPPKLKEEHLKGLAKMTRLVIARAPELTDSVLLTALTYAPSLKHLELIDLPKITYTG